MTDRKKLKQFKTAYCTFYPLVFSILYSRVRNSSDAEDICQEVFIRFFNNFEEIEFKKPWLLKSIRFEISNYYRKKSNVTNDESDIDEFNNDTRLAFVNGEREARIILGKAMENKENFRSEDEMVLFDLVAIHNFSYNKAGAFLGLSKSQAEYKYNQIEKRMLEYLKKMGINGIGDIV